MGMLAVVSACGGSDDDREVEISATALDADLYGDWPIGFYALRTEAGWAQLWAAHQRASPYAPARPAVDFQRHTLIGIALGWGPDGCHGLDVSNIVESQAEIRVDYRLSKPSRPGADCSLGVVALVYFATIPATQKPIRFQTVEA